MFGNLAVSLEAGIVNVFVVHVLSAFASLIQHSYSDIALIFRARRSPPTKSERTPLHTANF